jgi:hypothetical protein
MEVNLRRRRRSRFSAAGAERKLEAETKKQQVPSRAFSSIRNDIFGWRRLASAAEAGLISVVLFGTAEAVPFPIRVKIKVNDNINVKGVGQECPTHTGKILGLKPALGGGTLRGAEAPLFHGGKNKRGGWAATGEVT